MCLCTLQSPATTFNHSWRWCVCVCEYTRERVCVCLVEVHLPAFVCTLFVWARQSALTLREGPAAITTGRLLSAHQRLKVKRSKPAFHQRSGSLVHAELMLNSGLNKIKSEENYWSFTFVGLFNAATAFKLQNKLLLSGDEHHKQPIFRRSKVSGQQ